MILKGPIYLDLSLVSPGPNRLNVITLNCRGLGNIDKVIDENNQLTTIEKLALRRGIERVNRRRDSQQAKIIKMVNSIDVKQNFQDMNNQLKLQILFNTVLKLKRIYPSKSAMSKAPNNNTLPPYNNVTDGCLFFSKLRLAA